VIKFNCLTLKVLALPLVY